MQTDAPELVLFEVTIATGGLPKLVPSIKSSMESALNNSGFIYEMVPRKDRDVGGFSIVSIMLPNTSVARDVVRSASSRITAVVTAR